MTGAATNSEAVQQLLQKGSKPDGCRSALDRHCMAASCTTAKEGCLTFLFVGEEPCWTVSRQQKTEAMVETQGKQSSPIEVVVLSTAMR